MRGVLLDTDVFSFLFKRETRAALYAAELHDAQLCLSFQSVAELRYWALVRGWGDARRDSLEQAMTRYVLFPYDDLIARCWAELTAHRRRLGHPIECGDAWIAATAVRHDLTLVTHNGQHYSSIPGLKLVSYTGGEQ